MNNTEDLSTTRPELLQIAEAVETVLDQELVAKLWKKLYNLRQRKSIWKNLN